MGKKGTIDIESRKRLASSSVYTRATVLRGSIRLVVVFFLYIFFCHVHILFCHTCNNDHDYSVSRSLRVCVNEKKEEEEKKKKENKCNNNESCFSFARLRLSELWML